MNNVRSKNPNHSDIQAGESLFDFLKRKKKFALETSLSKSRQKQNININSNINKKRDQNQMNSSLSPHKRYEDTYRETMRQNKDNYNVNKSFFQTSRIAGLGATNTPKRVSFAEDKQKQKKLSAKNSFIELISPMRKKNNGEKTPQNVTHRQISLGKENEKGKTNPQQQFFRKNLNNSVSALKGAFQKFITLSTSIKQKSHSLFIQLKPLLKIFEQSDNLNLSKRAEETKIKLRSFQYLFKEFHIENGNDLLQNFHRTFSQHLNSYESNLKFSFEKEFSESLKKIRQQKDNVIQDLKNKLEKREKQLDHLGRKLDKSIKQSSRLKQISQSNISKGETSYNSKISQLQQKVQQYQMEINTLAKDLDLAKQNEKNLQKSIKDLKYLKEQSDKRFIEENMRVKSTKQQFLLNQISSLKKQFNKDMDELSKLYATKQTEHLAIIQQLRQQVTELSKQKFQDKQVEGKIISEAVNSKAQLDKIKKQNESLISDLHRMNEQLYQHWIAMKDIKTLAVRLQIFPKFIKIYEDLHFNDQLFL